MIITPKLYSNKPVKTFKYFPPKIVDKYLIALWMKRYIQESPIPLALTSNISTNSRRLLKYWPTIMVELSSIMHTPTPADKDIRNVFEMQSSNLYLQLFHN